MRSYYLWCWSSRQIPSLEWWGMLNYTKNAEAHVATSVAYVVQWDWTRLEAHQLCWNFSSEHLTTKAAAQIDAGLSYMMHMAQGNAYTKQDHVGSVGSWISPKSMTKKCPHLSQNQADFEWGKRISHSSLCSWWLSAECRACNLHSINGCFTVACPWCWTHQTLLHEDTSAVCQLPSFRSPPEDTIL